MDWSGGDGLRLNVIAVAVAVAVGGCGLFLVQRVWFACRSGWLTSPRITVIVGVVGALAAVVSAGAAVIALPTKPAKTMVLPVVGRPEGGSEVDELPGMGQQARGGVGDVNTAQRIEVDTREPGANKQLLPPHVQSLRGQGEPKDGGHPQRGLAERWRNEQQQPLGNGRSRFAAAEVQTFQLDERRGVEVGVLGREHLALKCVSNGGVLVAQFFVTGGPSMPVLMATGPAAKSARLSNGVEYVLSVLQFNEKNCEAAVRIAVEPGGGQ